MLVQLKTIIFIIALLSSAQAQHSIVVEFMNIFQKLIEQSQTSMINNWYTEFQSNFLKSGPSYDKFNFIPNFVDEVTPGKSTVFQGNCFKQTTISLEQNQDGSYDLNLDLQKSSSFFCSDFYMFVYHGEYHFEEYYLSGSKKLSFKKPINDANLFDIQNNGIRIFQFQSCRATTLAQIAQNALMFIPEGINYIPGPVETMNLNFLKDYVGIEMKERQITDVEIDENLVHSGDFFGIIRLDGLDPMLAWGMGSTTGHTTIAHRLDGVLHVCESQAKGSYWETNGIQCTPFKKWIELAKKANFNVVWLPLRKEYYEKYDEQKATEFFRSIEGVDYGYPVLLTGWLDTYKNNLPCLPPTFERCMDPHLLDILFTTVESVSESASIIWKQAMGKRAGLSGNNYTISEAYHAAALKGISRFDIYQIPEDDKWTYIQSRYGNSTVEAPAQVCCVFVCKMLKAGGIFGEHTDNINCGEFTNTDVYKLDIYDHDFQKPEACQKADPENPICQLLGKHELNLFNGPGKGLHCNVVPIVPHMSEKCPSQNPDYQQEPDC